MEQRILFRLTNTHLIVANTGKVFSKEGFESLGYTDTSTKTSNQTTIPNSKEDAGAWFNIGSAYGNLERYEDAVDAYQHALRIDPERVGTWNTIGLSYGKLGRYEESIDAYQHVLRIIPEHAGAWYNIGVAYGELGRDEDAVDAYQHALRIDPERADAWNNIGRIYAISGDTKAALDAVKELRNDLDNRQIEVHDKNRQKILYVGWDDGITESYSSMLKNQYGHDSYGIRFNDPYELMEQVDSIDYDILIIEIVMPGFNGLELTKMIRNIRLYTPIILTTGWTEPPIALESMKSGADDLILHPVSKENLTSSIESVLKQRGLQIKNRNRDYQVYNELKFKNMSHTQYDLRGLVRDYYETGKFMSHTQDSDLHGLVRDYYETGELMAESTYKEGKLCASKVYRKWGTLLFEGSFRNGLADRRCKWFTAKGQVYREENYKNGHQL